MEKETSNKHARKQELKKSADDFKRQLEDDLNHSADEIIRIGKYTLIVGVVSLVGYAVTRYFSSGKKDPKTLHKENESKSSILDGLVAAGTEVAAVYLLSFAKSKLKDYLKELNKLDKKTNEPSSGTGTK